MTTRREFFRKSALAGAGLVFAGASSKVNAASYQRIVGANRRINIAHVGIGNRGWEIIRDFDRTNMVNVTALCDVDLGGPNTGQAVAAHPEARTFKDFREMFDKASHEFEAVTINTPDFSHFPVTMRSIASGKHVFVEKPLARTFLEVDLMEKIAKKYPNVVTAMCNQGHSGDNYHQFRAWKEAGLIKDIYAVTAHMNNARRWHPWDPSIHRFPRETPTPETLDWDAWLSQSFWHDFAEGYYHQGQWRGWYSFGMGALGDWGAHLIDTVHRFLELGMPYEVDPTHITYHNDYFFPMCSTIEFKFPARGNMPPLDLTWYDGVHNIPMVPEGFGDVPVDPNIPTVAGQPFQPTRLAPGKILYGRDITFRGGSHASALQIIPAERARAMEAAGQVPDFPRDQSNHFENFCLAINGQEESRSNFEVAGPLSKVFCLGVVTQRLNRKIRFDRQTNQIINDPIANALLVGPPPRKGWEDYYVV